MRKWSWLTVLFLAAVVLTMAGLSAASLLDFEPGPHLMGPGHLIHRPEHFVALIAVGVWAGRRGGASLWALPLSFAAGMALGCVVGAHQPEPRVDMYVQAAVLASTLALVLAASLALPVPSWEATGTLMALGMCQGYVDGVEMGLGGLVPEASLLATVIVLLVLGAWMGSAGLRRQ